MLNEFELKNLPPIYNFDTPKILKALIDAHRHLAELKGVAETIPNQSILINTLSLQEAKDSSAVENIITTHDELYRQVISINKKSSTSKEVQYYAAALRLGGAEVLKDKLLTNRHILSIQSVLEGNNAGFRKLPGTKLINEKTQNIVYTPPQQAEEIISLMKNLESYINTEDDIDALVKMAIVHFQFESIHPFYDGNGRTGRIINMLYLVKQELLNSPVLYLSRYILKNKNEYYKNLQDVRNHNNWENWILYMLRAVSETSVQTIETIQKIKQLFKKNKHHIRDKYKFYSQDLINNLFSHPYTKVDFLTQELGVTRITAAKYLDTLVADGILEKKKIGRSNFYIHKDLLTVLKNIEN